MALDPLHLIIWEQTSRLVEVSDLDSIVTRYNYNKQTLNENLRCSIIQGKEEPLYILGKINHLCKLIQCTSGIRFICLLYLGSRDGFGVGKGIRAWKALVA